MTGHDLDLEACKRIPHPVAKMLVAEIESLRAKLAAAEQERDDLDRLAADRYHEARQLRAALAAVRELHKPYPAIRELLGEARRQTCYSCDHGWPCPTIRALAAAEQDEPKREQS